MSIDILPNSFSHARHHHVVRTRYGEVLGIYSNELDAKNRQRRSGGSTSTGFLKKGERYRDFYAQELTLIHGRTDDILHKPGEE